MLSQKVQAIEEVFALLTQEISTFQGWSGLACKSGCGKCCNKSDIEATVIEFLPLAHHLYLLNQCEDWLARLQLNESLYCLLLSPTQSGGGFCSIYTHRGLICRLFGFSARTNKYAHREFVSCQTIKTEYSPIYPGVVERVGQGGLVPVMNQYYMRLHAIDSDLAREFFPVNEAIRRAIETVLHHYAYRAAAL